MKNRYRNPWAKSLNVPKPDFYENDAPCVLEYKGFRVLKTVERGFDFVLNDCCVTQRAGMSNARRLINDLLDGKEPVADSVAEHFTAQGVNFATYSHA